MVTLRKPEILRKANEHVNRVCTWTKEDTILVAYRYRNELINMIEVWNVRLIYMLIGGGKQSNKWRENESRIESKYTIRLTRFGTRMTLIRTNLDRGGWGVGIGLGRG